MRTKDWNTRLHETLKHETLSSNNLILSLHHSGIILFMDNIEDFSDKAYRIKHEH